MEMITRNFKKELCYFTYTDMEEGGTTEKIDYESLIGIITELCDRIEQLESDVENIEGKIRTYD
jgi:hypothetical protein